MDTNTSNDQMDRIHTYTEDLWKKSKGKMSKSQFRPASLYVHILRMLTSNNNSNYASQESKKE